MREPLHFQVLSSGSQGNALLLRVADTHVLLDAGLSVRKLEQRLEQARVSPQRIDHIALTHGHLDHARAAGALAKKSGARVHCCERLMRNASVRRAPILTRLRVGSTSELAVQGGSSADEVLRLLPVLIPHDADPTVAFRVEHAGRALILVTDMGRVSRQAAKDLQGAHVLVLEFNHDLELLRRGPYPDSLKRRVAGPAGHLSNEEASEMLRLMTGPELHTLVLAHLSETNNTPELAHAAAQRTLTELGRSDVRILVATQHEIGPNLAV